MKKYIASLTALMLIIGLSTSIVNAGSSTGSSGSGGSTVTSVYNTAGGSYGTISVNGVVTQTFSTNCQNCAVGGGSPSGGGGGGGSSSGVSPSPSPTPSAPPLVCKIKVDKPVIGLGKTTITVSWLPSPTTNVSLQRTETIPAVAQGTYTNSAQQASIILAGGGGGGSSAPKTTPPKVTNTTLIAPPSTAQSYIDTVNEASPGTITYKVSFNSTGVLAVQHTKYTTQQASIILAGGGGGSPPPPPPPSYACTATVKIVSKLTECNDGIDNADPEDTLVDQQDPACHTDYNPGNFGSYDPLRTTETNPAVDVVGHIIAPLTVKAQSALSVTASEQNVGTIPATTNSLVSGWRSFLPGATPSCGINGSLCFTANGNSYIRMSTLVRAYASQQTSTDTPWSFTPQATGIYEVCAVADYNNVVAEGVAGESNNVACQPIQVLASNAVITPPPAAGPLGLVATPGRVKRGGTATIVWNTGARTECTVTGTNGQTIYLAGTSGISGTTTKPITSETKYTLTCADDNTSTETSVKLLPQYTEI